MPRAGRRAARAALATLPLCAALLGCGVAAKTVTIHPESSDAARQVWSVDFVREFTIAENFRYQTEEYGTIVADPARGLLYASSRDGTLLALDDVDGSFVWEMDLGGGLSGVPVLLTVDLELERGQLATGAQAPDWMLVGTDDGSLVALDLEAREVRWSHRTGGVVREAAVLGEGVIHFVNSRDQVVTVDLTSGDWIWEYAGEFQKDFTVFGRAGLAYLPPAEPGDSGVLFTGFADGRVAAIDATSGGARWVEPLAPADTKLFVDVDTTPLIDVERGELVVANQASGLYALALEDGARRWNTPVRAVGSLGRGPAGVTIAASSLEGIFGVEPDGRIRWHQQLDPGALAEPLIVGDTVFVAHSELGLFAYATGDGELLARLFTGSGSSGRPSFDPVQGRVYASSDRGQLYALRLLPD